MAVSEDCVSRLFIAGYVPAIDAQKRLSFSCFASHLAVSSGSSWVETLSLSGLGTAFSLIPGDGCPHDVCLDTFAESLPCVHFQAGTGKDIVVRRPT